jgi:type I restriction enzyme, S subunit
MSSAWKKARLGDVCRVIPGYAFKSSDWQDSGIPVVKIKNIKGDNSVDLSEIDCVPESLLTPNLQKFVLNDCDILVAMTGATAGKVGKVRTERPILLNQRVAKIAPVEADHEFIWSVVSSEEYQKTFFHLADGAAQPNMSGSQIEGVEIPLPPLPLQRRIAGILSAYDELMENCQHRARILEAMNRALYREWFVHFRFPGYEELPRVASPLGDIPKGWEVKRLGDIADISWGDTSTTKSSYVEDGYVAYSASGPDGQLDHYDFDRTGIVPSAIGAQCGRTWLARGKWSCIKNTIRFWSKDDSASTELLFIATEGQDFWPRRGAAQPFISQGDAERKELLIPDGATMKQFTAFAEDALEQIAVLQAQIQNLRRTRDLLLPRLLSGQVNLTTN